MMSVPPVPFLVRAALVTPLLAIAGVCLAIVAWVTPEVDDKAKSHHDR